VPVPGAELTTRPEERLVLAVLRSLLSADRDAGATAAVHAEGIDWERLVSVASAHGVVPLVHHGLAGGYGASAPEAGRQQVRDAAERSVKRSLHLTASLLNILDALAAQGIEAVPWKGPALAQALWGDVGLRQYVDLDLLVRRGDVQRAGEALVASGFRRRAQIPDGQQENYVEHFGELEFVRGSDGITVELHWTIVPSYYASAMDARTIWGRLETIWLAGRQMKSLAAEDVLIGLAIHGFKHKFERLEWVMDIARLIQVRPELDWGAIRERTREHGSQRIVRVALGVAWRLFGSATARAAGDQMGADATADRIADELAREVASRVPDGHATHISTMDALGRERRRDRVAYFIAAATRPNPADWRAVSVPRRLGFLYVAVRPVRLLRRSLSRRR
jgi:hypothetical protein